MEVLTWLENTFLGQFIQSDPFAHPILLCFHAVGMGIVVGLVLMFDLRVLGYPKGLPLRTFQGLIGLGWIGFAMNAASGVLMFVSEASTILFNWTFQLKLALIALGGLSLWIMGKITASLDPLDGEARFPTGVKVWAVISALLWIGAIVAGRYIAYTLKPNISLDG